MCIRDSHQTPEEFGEIVIRANSDGTLLRLKDIADIELGSESYAYKGYTNGHPGVSTMIFQTAGSNATQVVNDVNALLDEVQAELPKGIAVAHLQSVNDFLYASMKEVVRRRYSRAIEEGSPLPDLIITDGGKGQMEVVREVIEDELHLDIPIAGLAKDRKHRTSELLYGFPPLTIGVKQSTPLFHLLENIQNEVHRFAITFHRDKRSKSQVASALDNIKGIGEKRKTALLKTFKSVSRIRQASLEEIAAVVGEAAAKNIKENLTE